MMFGDKTKRKRHGLACSLERAAMPERPHIGRGPRYIVHPDVTAACAPSLLAIAAALRADPSALDDDGVRQVQSFLRDGAGSPFMGQDATVASHEAIRLRHLLVAPEPAVLEAAEVDSTDGRFPSVSPALTGS